MVYLFVLQNLESKRQGVKNLSVMTIAVDEDEHYIETENKLIRLVKAKYPDEEIVLFSELGKPHFKLGEALIEY